MKLWAIREFGTDKYLPEIGTYKGYSYTEPTNEGFPRFHHTLRSAQNALTAWLQGKWHVSASTNYWSGESDYYVEPRHVEGRHREAMEIVEFNVTEVLK